MQISPATHICRCEVAGHDTHDQDLRPRLALYYDSFRLPSVSLLDLAVLAVQSPDLLLQLFISLPPLIWSMIMLEAI